MPEESPDGRPRRSFTGRTRRHRNRWGVKLADSLARWFITIGGSGTIVAVLLVFVFLLSVALPLFWPSARLEPAQTIAAPWTARPWACGVNEYGTLAWALTHDGQLRVFRADTGETLSEQPLCADEPITAVSYNPVAGDVVVGLKSGACRIGHIRFAVTFRPPEELPEDVRQRAAAGPQTIEGGLLERTAQGQFRFQTCEAELADPLPLAEQPLVRLDHSSGAAVEGGSGKGPTIAAATADGRLTLTTTRFNELSGKYKRDEQVELPRSDRAPAGVPFRVLVAGRGDTVYAVWEAGQVLPFDTRDLTSVQPLDVLTVLDGPAPQLTACEFVLGRETVVFGDSSGALSAWFPVRRMVASPGSAPNASSPTEITRLERTHRLPSGPAAVTALGLSQRSRLLSAGFADGSVAVYHVTTEQRLVTAHGAGNGPIRFALLGPKDDALVAAAEQLWTQFSFDPRHPEGSLAALFRPVWYEGYDRPSHVWQSSFAGVEPEMKLGLWPLVFGTLKATLYSMLFGVPVALLAAIYTAEFMSPRVKGHVKPMIEMMASLPSVVLGFLAALVLAPLVERSVPEILTSFATVPLALIVGSALWQLLPSSWVPYVAFLRWPAIIVTSALGVCGAVASGDLVERQLFAGDILRWLDGQIGRGAAGWLLLTIPAAAVATTVVVGAVVNPWLRQRCGDWSRPAFGLLNAGKLGTGVIVTLGLAWGVAELLDAAGCDPRGTFVATYVQRNALVVGFVMGFAIIPLIYTLADDALSTVPQHLRSASLGAGATPWQTAVRVVIPTAMSGLFSAVMIGLGRAVGETMIVLMAGGNTPVTEWNLFNGFRTLSANIAVELPEAVRDSTHFRTLFLAALTLFFLTFLVNTAAEIVRLRFRRRALQL